MAKKKKAVKKRLAKKALRKTTPKKRKSASKVCPVTGGRFVVVRSDGMLWSASKLDFVNPMDYPIGCAMSSADAQATLVSLQTPKPDVVDLGGTYKIEKASKHLGAHYEVTVLQGAPTMNVRILAKSQSPQPAKTAIKKARGAFTDMKRLADQNFKVQTKTYQGVCRTIAREAKALDRFAKAWGH